jgi:DNA polymerase-3 subunit delta
MRALTLMARQLQGNGLSQVLAQVWDKRKPLVGAALQRVRGRQWWYLLQRCAQLDRVIKGRAAGSAWDELLQLTLSLAGVNALNISA